MDLWTSGLWSEEQRAGLLGCWADVIAPPAAGCHSPITTHHSPVDQTKIQSGFSTFQVSIQMQGGRAAGRPAALAERITVSGISRRSASTPPDLGTSLCRQLQHPSRQAKQAGQAAGWALENLGSANSAGRESHVVDAGRTEYVLMERYNYPPRAQSLIAPLLLSLLSLLSLLGPHRSPPSPSLSLSFCLSLAHRFHNWIRQAFVR